MSESHSHRIASPRQQSIAIPSVVRAETTMKSFLDKFRSHDRYIVRQGSIDHFGPPMRFDRFRNIEVTHLPIGVRSAVGSASSHNLAIFARDLANGIFQCALNGSLFRLCGPAAKFGSVVCDDEFYSISRQAPTRRYQRRRLVACRFSSSGCIRPFVRQIAERCCQRDV